MIGWFWRNWFLIGLFVAAAAGFAFPEAGARGGLLRTELTTLVGIAVLFFVRGLLLPLRELTAGVVAWRLHLQVHGFIFVIMPLGVIVLLEALAFLVELPAELRIGFIFLAALPTTVSTAAAFTALARGNAGAAVFNATVSNCLGVLIVPLWVAWMLQREATPPPVGPVIFQIMLIVLLPLLTGQAVKPFLPVFPSGLKKALEALSSAIILFVIFAAFANSVVSGVWADQGWGMLAGACILAGVLFAVACGLAIAIGKLLRLPRRDFICLFFTGPQKTLAGGVPVAQVIFSDSPSLTLILLPLLFYHFIQLFAGGFAVTAFQKPQPKNP